MYPNFPQDIDRMNTVYQLATIPMEHAAMVKRLEQFKEILDKEFAELEDIQIDHDKPGEDKLVACKRTMVGMADILCDIIVYCASEGKRWNLPMPQVLELVMDSNFSKLGVDGLPIKNPVTDKFEKGPNYWKPEPFIYAMLFGISEGDDEGILGETVKEKTK